VGAGLATLPLLGLEPSFVALCYSPKLLLPVIADIKQMNKNIGRNRVITIAPPM